MGADVLSDLLRTVRLTGATFFDVTVREPWVAEQPPREMILRKILPGFGVCWDPAGAGSGRVRRAVTDLGRVTVT